MSLIIFIFLLNFSNANNQFGLKVFQSLIKEKQVNTFISPFSIFEALLMTYNGANGKTAEAFKKSLFLEDLKLDSVNRINKKILKSFRKEKGNELKAANALFAKKEVKFKKEFFKINKDYYDAEIKSLDFNNPKTLRIINDWVKKKTKGKIEKIIDLINPMAVLYLINAIYFKGLWEEKFDKKNNFEGDFNLVNGRKKKVIYMRKEGDFLYYENEKLQAIYLPYLSKKFGFYIFLPKERYSLSQFVNDLNYQDLKNYLNSFSKKEGEIILPKFKIEYEKSLNEVLKELNLSIAFHPYEADFSKMADVKPQNLFISEVKHKSYIEVTEEGTEAAAVTSVEVSLTAIRERFKMICDRPFLFLITERENNLILFIGALFEP
ncbi:MAG: serpin family protein [candidate division WOR-3 bacterium]|nr:serpin family protein [candidate division WOR-3 bacterium]